MIDPNSPKNQMTIEFAMPEATDIAPPPEYVDIPPDMFRQMSPDEQWLHENCERVLPDYDENEGGYTKALEALALDLRARIAFNADDMTRLVSLAEKIKHTLLN